MDGATWVDEVSAIGNMHSSPSDEAARIETPLKPPNTSSGWRSFSNAGASQSRVTVRLSGSRKAPATVASLPSSWVKASGTKTRTTLEKLGSPPKVCVCTRYARSPLLPSMRWGLKKALVSTRTSRLVAPSAGGSSNLRDSEMAAPGDTNEKKVDEVIG